MVQGNIHGADAYYLNEVIFESSSLTEGASIDLSRVTTDIDIYENLDRPYLTADLVFIDTSGFADGIGIKGGENIRISFRRRDSDFNIIKNFKVLRTAKSARPNNDNGEMIALTLVEDCVFDSELQGISKSYTGSTFSIIKDILNQYLNKNVETFQVVREMGIKTIIPNLSPIRAINYVKRRASTDLGMPFFVYSSLFTDTIHFNDLGSMMSQEPMFKFPFVSSQTRRDMSISEDLIKDIFTILDYDIENQDNILETIQQGYVGSHFNFYDTFSGQNSVVKYNIVKDAFIPLFQKDVIKKSQSDFLYNTEMEFNGQKLHDRSNGFRTRVHTSGSYYDGVNAIKSIGEETLPSDFKKRIVSESLQFLIRRNPITIRVPCHAFIEGDEHTTIGKIVDLQFMNTEIDGDTTGAIDRKKSGQYIIHNCRHMLKKEKYEIVMTCLKIANLEEVE